jgi:hypothetical protein
MKNAAGIAAAWMLTMVFAATAPGQESPAFPPFRMEAVGPVGQSYQNRPGEWTVVDLGNGPKTVFVDGTGMLIEHRLVSWELGVPTESYISCGQLFVRHGGRTYRFAPQGMNVPGVGVAAVTRPHQGCCFTWMVTRQELVPTTQWVPMTQWVEVPSSAPCPIAPTAAPNGGASVDRRRPNTT